MAAAVVMGTIPGLRFYQDGQLEGKRVRVPVQLAREPGEFPDPEIALFYRSLLGLSASACLHSGRWSMLEVAPAWVANESHRNIIAWEWGLDSERVIVAVNYSGVRSQAWIKPAKPTSVVRIVLEDALTGTTYVREPDELAAKGLYVDLGPYRAHVMRTRSF